jgi:3-oxoacyl-[acyl-carrier-protein] synthase II
MPPRRVVITGAGVLSPLGDAPAAMHRALSQGVVARRPIELFATAVLGPQQGGEIRPFDPQSYVGERNLRPLDRTSRLLVVAAQLALAASGWSEAERAQGEVGLVAGTTFCSLRTIAEFDRRAKQLGPTHASPFEFANSVINAAAGQTAIWHHLRGVNSTLAAGEASGLLAIAQAAELVRTGRAKAVLAGGVEELCFESFISHARAERLCGTRRGGAPGERPVPFDEHRNGFSLSEGAGLLMLEDAADAAARRAVPRAEVLGWGAAFAAGDTAAGDGDGGRGGGNGGNASDDADRLSAPVGSAALAEALARAVHLALADAGLAPGEIDFLSTSASGSPVIDRAEALGIAAGLGGATTPVQLPAAAVKAMLGEGMGASGAWQAIDLVETFADGLVPGIAGLQGVEPGLPLAGLSAASRQLPPAAAGGTRRALATAISADGHCAALIFGSVKQQEEQP